MTAMEKLAEKLATLAGTSAAVSVVGTVVGPAPDQAGHIEVDLGDGTRIIPGDAEEGETVLVEVAGNQARRAAIDLAAIAQKAADNAAAVAYTAQASANGKGRNLYCHAADLAGYEPFTEYDTWFDPDNRFRMHHWTGGVWEAALFGGEALGQAAITAGSGIIGEAAIGSAQISALDAGKISTGLMSALITLSGVIQTAESGARVLISDEGIFLFNADGDPVVAISTLGDAIFRGVATLSELDATGPVSLSDPGNVMQPGSVLTLQAGLQAPSTIPTVTNTWPSVVMKNSAGQEYSDGHVLGRLSNGHIVYDPVDTFQTYGKISIHTSTGAWVRDVEFNEGSAWLMSWGGGIIVNDHLVYVVIDDDEKLPFKYRLAAVNLTTGYITSYWGTGSNWELSGSIGTNAWDNGTRLIIQESKTKLLIHTFTWSGDNFTTSVTTKTVDLGGRTLLARSNLDLGVDSLFAAGSSTQIDCYTYSTGAANPAGSFHSPVATSTVERVGWYGGFVWVSSGTKVYTLDGYRNGSGLTIPLRVQHALYDSVGTGHESAGGPITSFAHKQRARIKLSAPGWVPDTSGVDTPNQLRWYAGLSTGSLYAQGNNAAGSIELQTLTLSGTTPRTTSNFPDSTPSEIRSANGELVLRADGSGAIPATMISGVVLSTNYGTLSGSGGDVNGGYEKHPNGRLTCWVRCRVTPTANAYTKRTWTFPVAFAELPVVTVTPEAGTTTVTGTPADALSLTDVGIGVVRSNTTATYILAVATGFWKAP